MSHYMRTGPAAGSRSLSQGGGVWEVVGILAAVVPCGVFAGLYLATADGLFLGMFILFAIAALVIVVARNPQRFAGLKRLFDAVTPARRRDDAETDGDREKGTARTPFAGAAGAATALKRTFTIRILKLLAFVAWILVWGVTASLYVDVFQDVNFVALMSYVAIGALSPIIIYVALEGSVKRLGGHMNGREDI